MDPLALNGFKDSGKDYARYDQALLNFCKSCKHYVGLYHLQLKLYTDFCFLTCCIDHNCSSLQG